VVPWLVSGFESVGKCAEEANPNFKGRSFSVAIFLTIFAGLAFYLIVIVAVSYVAPWQSLNSQQQFPTAVAFERALHAHWIVLLIMGSALVALVQAFNANMVASSRLLFAMSRRNLLNPKISHVHPVNRTPSMAIIAVGVATALIIFLGEALLIPILEVGAVTASVAWMAACASYYRMKPPWHRRAAAIFGLVATSVMIMVKVVPLVPGHFTSHEWIALAIWGMLGIAVRSSRHRGQPKESEMEQAKVKNYAASTKSA
jgi:basic amino acid/polyamine antiporter, APA family